MDTDRKTVFDLEPIIRRCFEEAKKMGYINDKKLTASAEGIEVKEGISFPQIVNQDELVHHIALTVVGELYEFEIIRRIAPIFRENRALSADFQMFGDAFQLFYDKTIADSKLRGIRIHPEGQ